MRKYYYWTSISIVLTTTLFVMATMHDRSESDPTLSEPTKGESGLMQGGPDVLENSTFTNKEKLRRVKETDPNSTEVYQADNIKSDSFDRDFTWLNDEELDQLQAYFERRGYPSDPVPSDYQGYSLEQLESLSDQNDPKATRILAARYGMMGKGEDAYRMHLKAAVLGYSASVIAMADYHSTQYKYAALNGEQKKQQAINAMAAHKSAMMMGDPMAVASARSFYNHSGIQFSEADRAKINRRAKELYEYLEQRRQQLGMDPLSEDRAEVVERYFVATEERSWPEVLSGADK